MQDERNDLRNFYVNLGRLLPFPVYRSPECVPNSKRRGRYWRLPEGTRATRNEITAIVGVRILFGRINNERAKRYVDTKSEFTERVRRVVSFDDYTGHNEFGPGDNRHKIVHFAIANVFDNGPKESRRQIFVRRGPGRASPTILT